MTISTKHKDSLFGRPRRWYLIIILFLSSISTGISQYHHPLENITAETPAYRIFNHLLQTSGALPLAEPGYLTYTDLEEAFLQWKLDHPKPEAEEEKLCTRLEEIFSEVLELDMNPGRSFTPTLEVEIGIDYLHRQPIHHTGQDSVFYTLFKDRDFVRHYDDRGNLIDVRIKSSYWHYLYFDSQFALRESWQDINSVSHHFPRDFHDIENNFNRETIFLFRIPPILIVSGRDRLSMGPGRHGNLLVSNSLPPLDIFRFSVNFGDYFKFYDFIAPMNNIFTDLLDETVPPKYLLGHRLAFQPKPNLRISVSELMVINSQLQWSYLNPLNIFHNMSNSVSKNILSGLDIEYQIKPDLYSYLSLVIDEIDFYLIEPEGEAPLTDSESRFVYGVQLGLDGYSSRVEDQPLWSIEWVKLNKWLYNYAYQTQGKDLTYTYIDRQDFPEQDAFYRFIGHYLGSNAEALYLDFNQDNWGLFYQYIDQGEMLILQPSFSEDYPLPHEYKQILGAKYHLSGLRRNWSLDFGLNHTWNIHSGYDPLTTVNRFEFWIEGRFTILTLKDVFFSS